MCITYIQYEKNWFNCISKMKNSFVWNTQHLVRVSWHLPLNFHLLLSNWKREWEDLNDFNSNASILPVLRKHVNQHCLMDAIIISHLLCVNSLNDSFKGLSILPLHQDILLLTQHLPPHWIEDKHNTQILHPILPLNSHQFP